jgi:hypothetical protein
MGMDVLGKNPKAPEGKLFQANVWYWHPLAEYVCSIAPELCCKCQYWQGRTESYAHIWESKQVAMLELCDICEGTGTRRPIFEAGAGDPKNGGIRCNACKGEGYHYPFSVELVQEFIAFLRASGGFMIY